MGCIITTSPFLAGGTACAHAAAAKTVESRQARRKGMVAISVNGLLKNRDQLRRSTRHKAIMSAMPGANVTATTNGRER
jgi:hypothetical protein